MSYLEHWWPLCSVEGNHLYNLGKWHYGEHSCGINLNLSQWFRRRCPLKNQFTDDGRQMKTNQNSSRRGGGGGGAGC